MQRGLKLGRSFIRTECKKVNINKSMEMGLSLFIFHAYLLLVSSLLIASSPSIFLVSIGYGPTHVSFF